MKKIYTIVFLFCAFSLQANEILLTQGKVTVSMDDFDGYAYGIPKDNRLGYLDSPQRIEKALFSMLNMMHVIKYGQDKNLIDQNKIKEHTANKIFNIFPPEDKYTAIEENIIKLMSDFISKKEQYRQIQKYITNSTTQSELLDLAKEKYAVNKSEYIKDETRDIEFISVIYDDNNKEQQSNLADELFATIANSVENFNELKQQYKNKKADIEVSSLNDFKYDTNNEKFSYQLFSIKNKGIHGEIIDFNNRFIITHLIAVTQARYYTFEEKSESLFAGLKQQAAERKFNSLLISLTGDKLEINKQAILSIRDRYKNL